MSLFDETVVKAKEVLDIASKKTNDMISVQKMKMNLASLNSQLTRMYEALGRLCCDNGEANTPNANMLEMMTEIDKKIAEIKFIEDKISAVKGDRICSSCGTKNVSEAGFCYRCGTKFVSCEEICEKTDCTCSEAEDNSSEEDKN